MPDFEFKIEVIISFQPNKKEICWDEKRENKLKGIYKKELVLSARKQ